jgi:hypothetical protein
VGQSRGSSVSYEYTLSTDDFHIQDVSVYDDWLEPFFLFAHEPTVATAGTPFHSDSVRSTPRHVHVALSGGGRSGSGGGASKRIRLQG